MGKLDGRTIAFLATDGVEQVDEEVHTQRQSTHTAA